MNLLLLLRFSRVFCHYAAAGAVLVLIACSLSAETMTLEPTKDTTIFSDGNGFSNGAGDRFHVGKTRGRLDTKLRRALLAFDLAGRIPANVQIDAVTLSLQITGKNPIPSNFTVTRLTSDWGESGSDAGDPGGRGTDAQSGDATWSDSFLGSQPWGTPGGDFVAESSASATATPIVPFSIEFPRTEFSSPQLAADVQHWVDNPTENFGWILRSEESRFGSAMRFSGRVGPAEDRPRLVIEFSEREPTDMAELFVGAADLGEGWKFLDWFGSWNDTFFPWIFHLNHSWQFVPETSTDDSFWAFDLGLGWLFTTSGLYPNYFSADRNAWTFYFVDEVDPRVFVDLTSGEFFENP